MTNDRRHLFWLGIGVLSLLFIYLIKPVLLPFVLGMGTAYFLDPAADRLEKLGLSRNIATLIITVCFFLLVVIILILGLPIILNQLSGLIATLPSYITDFEQKYNPQIEAWIGALPADHMESIRNSVSNFSGVMIGLIGGFVTGIFQSGFAIVTLLSLFLITPVVSFYLLRDWDHMVERIDRLLPRQSAETIRTQLRIIDDTVAGFIHGQINVCLILSFYYAVSLSLVGLNFGIVIGTLTGMLAILPYAGYTLGLILGISAALFQFDTLTPVFIVGGIFIFGQVLESYILVPKLVGEKVGLHPVWVIFGMLVGAALFGFVGVLLAIPATAIVGVLIRFALQKYMLSPYYQGESHLIPPRK